MSVYSPLLLPPPQLRGRELREILPPHDPRAFARFSQWLFVSHLPACWEVHSKFPRLPLRASARGLARAASAWGAEDARALVDRLFTPLRAQRVLLDAWFSAIWTSPSVVRCFVPPTHPGVVRAPYWRAYRLQTSVCSLGAHVSLFPFAITAPAIAGAGVTRDSTTTRSPSIRSIQPVAICVAPSSLLGGS